MERPRNLQLHISEEVFIGLRQVAREEGTSIANIVRIGISLFLAYRQYMHEGKVLCWEDRSTGEKADLIIPGTLHPFLISRSTTQPNSLEEKS